MAAGNGQLTFDLPHREAMGREDFLVTASNAAAVALIDQWPAWPSQAAILVGPEGSGKTHLVEAWRQRSDAQRVDAMQLSTDAAPALLAGHALAVEDVSGGVSERALFHLMNLARQQDASLLLTSEASPESWGVKLPDLNSRLKALPIVRIMAPDDELLRAVLVKQFNDRQLSVDESMVSFVVARMPRSLAAARQLVAEADRRALAGKTNITRPLLAGVLQDISSQDLFGEDA